MLARAAQRRVKDNARRVTPDAGSPEIPLNPSLAGYILIKMGDEPP
jgi:hypothetical protein